MSIRRKWAGPPTRYEAKVSVISGGRVTIPERIRIALGLEVGNEVLIVVQARAKEVHMNIEPADVGN